VSPDQRIEDALSVMRTTNLGSAGYQNGKLVGILTHRDLRFEKRLDRRVGEVMTKENLVTARPGVSLEEAKDILHANRIEKLLVVDDDNRLRGLITVKDIQKTIEYPLACKDDRGRLRVGAAVGVGPDREARVEALVRAGVDVLAVDTAHGHSKNVIDAVRDIKAAYRDVEVIAGNVGTEEGTRALVKAGRTDQGGNGVGSICTTRVISGRRSQLTAVLGAVRGVAGTDVAVIADGGVRYSGDHHEGAGGGRQRGHDRSLFAGTEESRARRSSSRGAPTSSIGMGSIEAMKQGSRDRSSRPASPTSSWVPEGIEGARPVQGQPGFNIHQLVGGLKAGWATAGAVRSRAAHADAVSSGERAAFKESHVHDVVVTKEAPNYRLE